jgi:hypothetical protein
VQEVSDGSSVRMMMQKTNDSALTLLTERQNIPYANRADCNNCETSVGTTNDPTIPTVASTSIKTSTIVRASAAPVEVDWSDDDERIASALPRLD